jgi:Ca-activated chloride channel family protein
MLNWAYPGLLLALLLPLALRLLPAHRTQRAAIRVPWFRRLATFSGSTPQTGAAVTRRSRLRWAVDALCFTLAVTALARPQILEAPIYKNVSVRDILLLVDLSGSMETEDFTNRDGEKADRLTAVKEVLDDFLTQREGDRVGLVVFGNAAFVQVPFTRDIETARLLLQELQPRMAGPKTAFGDSIGLGITLFENSNAKQRAMIALTDGNDTGSRIPPTEAATIAAEHEITIHVVAVGDPEAAGEEKLDIDGMEEVARKTDGQFYTADNRKELAGIYEELNRLEEREMETISHRPRRELFPWPVGAVLLISLISYTVPFVRRRELA